MAELVSLTDAVGLISDGDVVALDTAGMLAVHCGMPAANGAFALAQRVLAEQE